ncbi:MAG: hypothetical protein KDH96_10460, partial [Candidatus Riesia sp.]|nr:hypothetical protein [Candidatus Riesia sp.]
IEDSEKRRVVTIDGANLSEFKREDGTYRSDGLHVGDYVNGSYTESKKGNYTYKNIFSIAKTDPPQESKQNNTKNQQSTNNSIAKSVALKAAVENTLVGAPANEVIELAKEFEKYLKGE